MTHDEAVKWLEDIKQDIGQIRHEDLWHYEQAISEIQELLKEEAVEPIKSPDKNDDYTFMCSNCKGELFCGDVLRDNFCPTCGRKVKWE